jgi:hypothetical protein
MTRTDTGLFGFEPRRPAHSIVQKNTTSAETREPLASLEFMLDYFELPPDEGKSHRMPQHKTDRLGQMSPSVREFIERRNGAGGTDLPGLLDHLRKQLETVNATIRIFKRIEARRHRHR